MPDISNGSTVMVMGSSGTRHTLRNVGGVYSCSCAAWRNQSRHPSYRTCGHLLDYRGDEVEALRIRMGGIGAEGMPSTVMRRVGPFWRGERVAASPAVQTSVPAPRSVVRKESLPAAPVRAQVPEPTPLTVWDRLSVGADPFEGAEDTEPASRKQEGLAVLLAHAWDGVMDPTSWLMSEKLDGVRAYWNGKDFVSRLGNVFAVPDWFKEGMPDHHLDGEFWVGRGRFQETSGIVRRLDKGDEWAKVKYVAFDLPEMDAPFTARYNQLSRMTLPYNVEVVTHVQCVSLAHLRTMLEAVEAKGGEGLMLRDPQSKYERCRSHSLLKVKTFHDDEATVKGHTAGKGKHRGKVGALICQAKNGRTFQVGTGLSDAERANPPPVGSTITYRYQELTRDGVPRFPSYVGRRDYE